MIRIVVDSGCQATPELVVRLGLNIVPLTVVVDGVLHREGVDLDAEGITTALLRGAKLSTATPSPGEFLAVYDSQSSPVLSVHTGGVSGTAAVARLAAGMASVPVEVVDTGTASFPVTLCAWAAADVLAAGGSLQAAAAAARSAASGVGNVFVVGALALARKGGRLAAEVPNEATAVVPVLALAEGEMRVVAQASDAAAAVDAMTTYVAEQSPGPLRIGVGHLGAPHLAAALEASLRARVEVGELVRYIVGPSIAVHSGVGTVGCVFIPIT